MSDDRWTRDQVISAVAAFAAVAGTVCNFIEPVTDAMGPAYHIVQPFLFMGIGVFVGYAVTRMLYRTKLERAVEEAAAPLRDEIAARDAEIARLTADPSPREMLEDMVPGFSRSMLRAIVKAYDADGMSRADDDADVLASVMAGQGVFIMEAESLHGVSHATGMYALTDGFRKALSACPDILDSIREGAEGK